MELKGWSTQSYGALSRSSNEEGNQIWKDSAVEREGESPHLQRGGLTMLKRRRERNSRFSILGPFLEGESCSYPLVRGVSPGKIPNIWVFL